MGGSLGTNVAGEGGSIGIGAGGRVGVGRCLCGLLGW